MSNDDSTVEAVEAETLPLASASKRSGWEAKERSKPYHRRD
ncbi:hypothetical protein [Natrinema sp. HArc-T2]